MVGSIGLRGTFGAEGNNTVALLLCKQPDMYLGFFHPQLALQPDVCRPFIHLAAAAHGIQSLVCLYPFAAQAGVGEGTHRAAVSPVCGNIRIAGRPAGAAVDIIALLADIAAEHTPGRDADGRRPAIGTGDFIFHGTFLLYLFDVLVKVKAVSGQSAEETVRHRMASA